MAAFKTTKMLNASPLLIPMMAKRIQEEFVADGYDVKLDALSSGGYDISITKGGFFKAVLGMRTALKVTLLPGAGTVNFEAGIGIFGQQVIPTVISMFFFWPVLITQVWGMVSQAQLDDRALNIATQVASQNVVAPAETSGGDVFCTNCGTRNTEPARFCKSCGQSL